MLPTCIYLSSTRSKIKKYTAHVLLYISQDSLSGIARRVCKTNFEIEVHRAKIAKPTKTKVFF